MGENSLIENMTSNRYRKRGKRKYKEMTIKKIKKERKKERKRWVSETIKCTLLHDKTQCSKI